jgi:type VI secretion system secreted protein Hcp
MTTINSRRRPGRGLPLLGAALLGLAGADAAAPRLAVRIATSTDRSETIPGESMAAGHEGWIDAIAFGQGFRQLPGTKLGSLGDFSFVKELDKSTPKLQEACCNGTNFPAVTIHWLAGDPDAPVTPTSNVTVELRDVSVIQCRLGNGSLDPAHSGAPAGGVPTEEVVLSYSEVVWRYNRTVPGQPLVETAFSHDTAMGTRDPASDDDNDGVINALDDDDDNDGVKDDYEVAQKMDPFTDDAELDNDHDKRSNRDEFIAGTSANDATSFFAVESLRFRRTPEGVQGHVAFPVAGGRHYRLVASPSLDLPREQWFTIDEFDVPAGSPDTAADVLLSPAVLRNAGNLFFNVEVSLASPTP